MKTNAPCTIECKNPCNQPVPEGDYAAVRRAQARQRAAMSNVGAICEPCQPPPPTRGACATPLGGGYRSTSRSPCGLIDHIYMDSCTTDSSPRS